MSQERAPTRPVSGTALVAAGLVTLAFVWTFPLERIVPGPFSAYMVMHMGVVAVAAPLLAIGVAGRRFDPVRAAPAVFAPVPASVVELVVVWGWHAPALHEAARTSPSALVLEQGMFLASGLLVWLAVFGGDARRRVERRGAGVVALLLTSMHMTLLGALLALPPRPLYSHGVGEPALSPLADQHLGGAIMLAVGGAVYLAGGIALTFELLRPDPATREREAT